MSDIAESRPTSVPVFLSHAGEETTAARELAFQLRRHGVEVWLDVERIQPGELWMKAIEAGLEGARALIVYVGRSGVERWVDSEVRVALDRSARDPTFRIAPVLGPGAVPEALPLFLKQYQWTDLRAGWDPVEALAAALAAPAAEQRGSLLPAARAPYLGLATFQVEDALLFYGREAEVAELLQKLRSNSFLAIIGGSGTGKSSLVRAGLVPALHRGRFEQEGAWVESWRVISLRPGPQPLRELAEALLDLRPDMPEADKATFLARIKQQVGVADDALATGIAALVPRGTHTLVFVDQFEELFTQAGDATERRRFVDALLSAARTGGERPVHVLVTLRADFYGHCWEHPELPKRIAANQSALKRLGRDQLREVVEKPLALAGAGAEPGLVEVLLDDTGDEPGNLALLEHALLQLWDRRRGQTLTHEAYHAIGGLSGALRNHAERVFAELGAEQELAKKILVRLTLVTPGSPDARRRATKAELRALGDEARVDRVLLALSRERLVTTGAGADAQGAVDGDATVEVSHEALIREWPRLRGWLDENRKSLIVERRLQQAADEWQQAQPARDPGLLLTGTRLAEAEELLRLRGRELAPGLLDFVVASRRQARREMRRTRLMQAVAVTGVSALLVVLGWLVYDARRRERQLVAETLFEQPGTGLSWTRKDNGTDIEWGHAQEYCGNLELLGRRGWRLPSVAELRQVHASSLNELRRTGDYIWSADATERGHVFFELNTGTEAFAPANFSNFTRAFCVSSRAAPRRR